MALQQGKNGELNGSVDWNGDTIIIPRTYCEDSQINNKHERRKWEKWWKNSIGLNIRFIAERTSKGTFKRNETEKNTSISNQMLCRWNVSEIDSAFRNNKLNYGRAYPSAFDVLTPAYLNGLFFGLFIFLTPFPGDIELELMEIRC